MSVRCPSNRYRLNRGWANFNFKPSTVPRSTSVSRKDLAITLVHFAPSLYSILTACRSLLLLGLVAIHSTDWPHLKYGESTQEATSALRSALRRGDGSCWGLNCRICSGLGLVGWIHSCLAGTLSPGNCTNKFQRCNSHMVPIGQLEDMVDIMLAPA